MDEQKNQLVVVSCKKPDGMSPDEFFELRREVSLLALSTNAKILVDPLNVKQTSVLQAAFEISKAMIEIIETTLLVGLEWETKLKGQLTIDEIPAVEKPEAGIFVF